jgi:hypothetical protein
LNIPEQAAICTQWYGIHYDVTFSQPVDCHSLCTKIFAIFYSQGHFFAASSQIVHPLDLNIKRNSNENIIAESIYKQSDPTFKTKNKSLFFDFVLKQRNAFLAPTRLWRSFVRFDIVASWHLCRTSCSLPKGDQTRRCNKC